MSQASEVERQERREHPRFEVAGEVALEHWLSANMVPQRAAITDVSQGGLFLSTGSELPEGSVVTIRVLADQDETAAAICSVVRRSDEGLGCRFLGLSPRAEHWIQTRAN